MRSILFSICLSLAIFGNVSLSTSRTFNFALESASAEPVEPSGGYAYALASLAAIKKAYEQSLNPPALDPFRPINLCSYPSPCTDGNFPSFRPVTNINLNPLDRTDIQKNPSDERGTATTPDPSIYSLVTAGPGPALLVPKSTVTLGPQNNDLISQANGEYLTRGLIVGDPSQNGNPRLFQFFQSVAAAERIPMVFVTPRPDRFSASSNGSTQILRSEDGVWMQDASFVSTSSGTVSLVPKLQLTDEAQYQLMNSLMQGRRDQYTALGLTPPAEMDGYMGRQWFDPATSSASQALAAQFGASTTGLKTLVEGGNVLAIAGGTILVGQQSVSGTSFQYGISDSESIARIGAELGASRVIVLPNAEFHIDMTVRPNPNSTMFVDDPRLATGPATQYLTQYAAEAGWSSTQLSNAIAGLNANANSDEARVYQAMVDSQAAILRAQGITVVRVPGTFQLPDDSGRIFQRYNMLNMVGGISTDGANIGIVGGAPELLQKPMEQLYLQNGYSRVYFTDSALANNLLADGGGGGMNCVTKLPGFSNTLALVTSPVYLGGQTEIEVDRSPASDIVVSASLATRDSPLAVFGYLSQQNLPSETRFQTTVAVTTPPREQIVPSRYMPGGLRLAAGADLGQDDVRLVMQYDGNLVVYDYNNRAYWASNTGGRSCSATTCFAVFQPDGNLVLSQNGVPYWSTRTGNPQGRLEISAASPYLTIKRADGGLIYNGTSDVTFQAGKLNLKGGEQVVTPAVSLNMQTDGNLVVYDNNNRALWASNTSGRNCSVGCTAIFQADGNLVLYRYGVAYWATNTINSRYQLKLSAQAPYLRVYDPAPPPPPVYTPPACIRYCAEP